jgi:hypothetical protein
MERQLKRLLEFLRRQKYISFGVWKEKRACISCKQTFAKVDNLYAIDSCHIK